MTVLSTGSVAYDYILTFRGHFGDHILIEQKHQINLSFLVDSMQRRRGGVATNYAYSLALLGHPVAILATVGQDGEEQKSWLEELGVDCQGLRILEHENTATGFTTTDADQNQITGYFGGAMMKADLLGLADAPSPLETVIIGPNAPQAMFRLVRECRNEGIPWVFDPAHQLPHLEREDLLEGCRGAWILIGNSYEMELIQQRTETDLTGLLELCQMVVVTLGDQGSQIATRDGVIDIPAAPVRQVVDPVGAGDAYRAGLVHGLLSGQSPEIAGRIAALAAAYAVEQTGTVEHHYTQAGFAVRYREAFGGDFE
ncbi:MAG: carbohydrate kinase family protein [Candidatus Dormibacteraceae bacterium]